MPCSRLSHKPDTLLIAKSIELRKRSIHGNTWQQTGLHATSLPSGADQHGDAILDSSAKRPLFPEPPHATSRKFTGDP